MESGTNSLVLISQDCFHQIWKTLRPRLWRSLCQHELEEPGFKVVDLLNALHRKVQLQRVRIDVLQHLQGGVDRCLERVHHGWGGNRRSPEAAPLGGLSIRLPGIIIFFIRSLGAKPFFGAFSAMAHLLKVLARFVDGGELLAAHRTSGVCAKRLEGMARPMRLPPVRRELYRDVTAISAIQAHQVRLQALPQLLKQSFVAVICRESGIVEALVIIGCMQ